jgi:hypothetical protein
LSTSPLSSFRPASFLVHIVATRGPVDDLDEAGRRINAKFVASAEDLRDIAVEAIEQRNIAERRA